MSLHYEASEWMEWITLFIYGLFTGVDNSLGCRLVASNCKLISEELTETDLTWTIWV